MKNRTTAAGLIIDAEARERFQEARRRAFERKEWVCRDGTVMPVSEMTDHHLLAATRMMLHNGYIGQRTLEFYLFGPQPDGEMAQLAWHQEFDLIMAAPVHPYLDLLEAEIKKRGLALEEG